MTTVVFPTSYVIFIIWFAFLLYSNKLAPQYAMIDNKKQLVITIEWLLFSMITGLIGIFFVITSILGSSWVVTDGTTYNQINIPDGTEPWLSIIMLALNLYIMVRTLGKRYGF